MRKLLLLSFTCIILFIQVNAQNRLITGTLKDANGNAVPDVSVKVKGINIGTVSNSNGVFNISVPGSANPGDVIRCSPDLCK